MRYFICLIIILLPSAANAAGNCYNDSSVGANAWTASGVHAPDVSYGCRAASDGDVGANVGTNNQISQYYVGHNFGFNYPVGSVVNGFECCIERCTTNAENTRDNSIILFYGVGNPVGDNKATLTYWKVTGDPPGCVYKNVCYGGAADLWGLTWCAAAPGDDCPDPNDININSPDLGCAVSFVDDDPPGFGSYSEIDEIGGSGNVTAADTPTPTNTPTLVYTATITYTPTETPTLTFTLTPTITPTSTATPNNIFAPFLIPNPTPTITPHPTVTPEFVVFIFRNTPTPTPIFYQSEPWLFERPEVVE